MACRSASTGTYFPPRMTWPLYPQVPAHSRWAWTLWIASGPGHRPSASCTRHLPFSSHLSSVRHPWPWCFQEGRWQGTPPPHQALPPGPGEVQWGLLGRQSWGRGEARRKQGMGLHGGAGEQWGPIGAPHSLGTLLQETSRSSKNAYNQSCASICNNLPRTRDESSPPINHGVRG